jgi:pyruvate ferredoxin oxidoreductase gamma subunit
MYRIRFHGRGGQGMKTASRILGSALFLSGYEVQDAPRYGAERRGAPIFAYVRADRAPINERGIITRPDLVIVADDSLVSIPAAAVMAGVDEHTVILINTDEALATWRNRLNTEATLITLPAEAEAREELRFIGASCAGAAARLLGVVTRQHLEEAFREELAGMSGAVIKTNLDKAFSAYEAMQAHEAAVQEGGMFAVEESAAPGWVDVPFEAARVSAPAIHAAATSVQVRTGLWRTLRPVIDYDRCNKCWWVCSTFCPDGAIQVDEAGSPHIDYDHCKGCMVCVAQCPPHAIQAVSESEALLEEQGGDA